MWDASNGEEVRVMNGHSAGVMSVAVSPDSTYIVSGSLDTTVRVWDMCGPDLSPNTFCGRVPKCNVLGRSRVTFPFTGLTGTVNKKPSDGVSHDYQQCKLLDYLFPSE
eukprot:PhF_6_TR3377/c2_g1_i1/m.4822